MAKTPSALWELAAGTRVLVPMSTLHRALPLDALLLALQGCSSIFTLSQLLLGEPAAAISFSEPCIAHGLGETATHAGIRFCGGMIPSKRQILPGFGFF